MTSAMDPDERRLLLESLGQVVMTAGADGLRAAVTGFGWSELLAEDPAVAVSGLATLQGEHLTTSTLLDDMVLAAAGIDGPAGVVYPDLPRSSPTSRLDLDRLTVSGVAPDGDAGRTVVAAWHDGDLAIVTLDEPLPVAACVGLDPDSGWGRVRTELPARSADVEKGAGAHARWQAMLAAGHRALAHELTAVGRHMLASAVEHVGSREQFGRRIGSFQAVKHALADVVVWQECAELAADAAWEDGRPESAAMAKILAGRFVRTAAANCQQVLGGMGFTWEHEFHRYLRRGLLLEPLLGSAAVLRAELGATIRSEGIPRLAPL